jgi:hypothetical protein
MMAPRAQRACDSPGRASGLYIYSPAQTNTWRDLGEDLPPSPRVPQVMRSIACTKHAPAFLALTR